MACPNSKLAFTAEQGAPIPISANIECECGQLLALVGPSGSGKSTLLRMIAGLSRPQSGRIMCADSVWFDSGKNICLSPQQRHIGYVPQHYGLFPHLSALDNIRAGLHHLTPDEQLRRAMEWLARVHLDGLSRHRPAELSGGQQQRVAVARALARAPNILLLDEPFSAVDRATRDSLYFELAELKQQLDIPVVMVTHDLNEALLLADRMTLLANGKTLQSGSPYDVMARPVDAIAARQVGIHNIFEGEIIRHEAVGGWTWLRAGPLTLATPLRPKILPGTRVNWVIPNSGVRLRAVGRDYLPSSHNRIEVTIQTLLPIGNEVRLITSMDGIDAPLHAQVPARLAAELHLAPGNRTTVVLREDAMHILDCRY
ncbi:MAG: ABC transporter ATP-binding protein [Glaciimonas sp.]|nr:ABC transporter ATP-binding protein [Glaciimonas sp.]